MNDIDLARQNAMTLWTKYATHSSRIRISSLISHTMSLRDNSDPFIYSRTFSHLMNNIYCPEDLGFSSQTGEAIHK